MKKILLIIALIIGCGNERDYSGDVVWEGFPADSAYTEAAWAWTTSCMEFSTAPEPYIVVLDVLSVRCGNIDVSGCIYYGNPNIIHLTTRSASSTLLHEFVHATAPGLEHGSALFVACSDADQFYEDMSPPAPPWASYLL